MQRLDQKLLFGARRRCTDWTKSRFLGLAVGAETGAKVAFLCTYGERENTKFAPIYAPTASAKVRHVLQSVHLRRAPKVAKMRLLLQSVLNGRARKCEKSEVKKLYSRAHLINQLDLPTTP